MSQFNKMRFLVLSLTLAGTLGGCAANDYLTHGYLDRRDQIELSAGDANASNIATQMVDPWPAYAGNKTIAFNGQRMQGAIERYRNNQVTPPQGISASGVYQQSSSNSPNNNGPGTTPIGPGVTQVK